MIDGKSLKRPVSKGLFGNLELFFGIDPDLHPLQHL